MSDTEELILDGGYRVATGLLPMADEDIRLCSALDEFPDSWLWSDEDIKDALVLNGIDRYTLDRKANAPRMRNQGSIGKCNASANAASMEQTRIRQGFFHIELSDCFTYIQVNGGGDNGSTLPSTFRNLQEQGMSPYRLQVGGLTKTFPNDVFRASQVDPDIYKQAQVESARFRGCRFVRLPLDSFEKFCRAAATCIARHIPIVWAWHVGSTGSRLNNGYMQLGKGPGNHANVTHSGKWVGGKTLVHPDNQNSWGPVLDTIYGPRGASWGEGGFGLTTMEGLFSCVRYHPPYALVSIGVDPNDSTFSL